MQRYVIERELPGAGTLSADELTALATRSTEVLATMAPRVQWLQSYVTYDKVFCVYIANDTEAVFEHARRGEFPADAVHAVHTIIDPTTAES